VAGASVDLTVSAIGRGTTAPFDIRILQNGNPIDVRHVTVAASGGPVTVVFTVSPGRDAATMYTAEIPSAAGELVVENNRRSVIVEPSGRKRRLLMIEGSPGFEHSFIKRALAADPALELDSVVRKGRDGSGDATYFVQADAERAPLLAPGFPNAREALFATTRSSWRMSSRTPCRRRSSARLPTSSIIAAADCSSSVPNRLRSRAWSERPWRKSFHSMCPDEVASC
jgi:hypothetical protein